MLYDIICPLCTRRFAANDVVFRHSAAGVNSVNADVADYRGTDYYMQAFNTRTGIKQNAVRMRAVDPAYFREQDKIYSNDLLVGLRHRGDAAGPGAQGRHAGGRAGRCRD